MAALNRAEKDVLLRLAAGRFHNGAPSNLRRLAAAGLLEGDPPRLTPEGERRVARLQRSAGAMHRRTWHVGTAAQLARFTPPSKEGGPK